MTVEIDTTHRPKLLFVRRGEQPVLPPEALAERAAEIHEVLHKDIRGTAEAEEEIWGTSVGQVTLGDVGIAVALAALPGIGATAATDALMKRFRSSPRKALRPVNVIAFALGQVFRDDPSGLMPEAQTWSSDAVAEAGLRCMHGRFAEGHAYVAHPAADDLYALMGTAHDKLLADKRAEALRLAAALGAKSIRLVEASHKRIAGTARAGLEVPVKGVPVDVGAEAGVHAESSRDFSLESTFGPIRAVPCIPTKVHWYHHEPMWQAMAETRLSHDSLTFKMLFNYTDDFGIDASVAAKVAGFGYSLGASFSAMRRVEQEYEVEFHPLP